MGKKKRLNKKNVEINEENIMTLDLDIEDDEKSNSVVNKKKKSGGFQSMGLSYSVLKGIMRKGYNVPTPIQRKTIPLIIEGKDIVAMARTGSGKTAAFLLPMFHRLKTHSAKTGVRALILSPTRELAMQTFKFTKELGKFTDLKSILILGGDSMEEQFSQIHKNPDIIIATPGRLLHVIVEMDLKLSCVEYLVFDEADRLFEMGFLEQLQEILKRIPDHRQTLLFSATLPGVLVDFVKAGLNNPALIRLDTDTKLSEHLKTSYFLCKTEEKLAVLLHLLKSVIKPKELSVIFVATRYHAEYIKEVLEKSAIQCTCIYSHLDLTARKINIAKFRTHKVSILIVTDIAARGIDIPHLDNVINYNFPTKPKLFVHRVGRVARAGRSGVAYSLIAPDEVSYLLDLHLFLGRPLCLTRNYISKTDGVCGSVPRTLIDEELEFLITWHENFPELAGLKTVCEKAYKQYAKSRPLPSSESVRRIKEILKVPPQTHPLFTSEISTVEVDRIKFLESMKAYHPNTTIFEVGPTGKSQASDIMRLKRKYHNKIIEKSRNISRDVQLEDGLKGNTSKDHKEISLESYNGGKRTLEITFSETNRKTKKRKTDFKDQEFYLPSKPADFHLEKGLEVEKSFDRKAANIVLDFTADDIDEMRHKKQHVKWDRKKKKFVGEDNNDPRKRKIKTESGTWIPASYKSDRYKQWKMKNKVNQTTETQGDSEPEETEFGKERPGMKKILKRNKKKQKFLHPELKTKYEILKNRERKTKLISNQKRRQAERSKRKENANKFKKWK